MLVLWSCGMSFFAAVLRGIANAAAISRRSAPMRPKCESSQSEPKLLSHRHNNVETPFCAADFKLFGPKVALP
jgi:hypothetical protein